MGIHRYARADRALLADVAERENASMRSDPNALLDYCVRADSRRRIDLCRRMHDGRRVDSRFQGQGGVDSVKQLEERDPWSVDLDRRLVDFGSTRHQNGPRTRSLRLRQESLVLGERDRLGVCRVRKAETKNAKVSRPVQRSAEEFGEFCERPSGNVVLHARNSWVASRAPAFTGERS